MAQGFQASEEVFCSIHFVNILLSCPWVYCLCWGMGIRSQFLAGPEILLFTLIRSGPRNVVGIATAYGLDGPGIESRWGRDFPHLSRPALGTHPASCTMGTGSFPGVRCGRGVTLTSHPLLVPRSKIE